MANGIYYREIQLVGNAELEPAPKSKFCRKSNKNVPTTGTEKTKTDYLVEFIIQ